MVWLPRLDLAGATGNQPEMLQSLKVLCVGSTEEVGRTGSPRRRRRVLEEGRERRQSCRGRAEAYGTGERARREQRGHCPGDHS